MARRNGIQIALDKITAEIEELSKVRQRLLDVADPLVRRERKPRKVKAEAFPIPSKRRSHGEGATTDSGNMNYPPA